MSENVFVCDHYHGVRLSDQTGEGRNYVENNLMVRAGDYESPDFFPWVRFAAVDGTDGPIVPQYGANGGEVHITGNYLTGIVGEDAVAAGVLVEQSNLFVDSRNDTPVSGEGTSEAQAMRAEEVFALPGATRTVDDELVYTIDQASWTTKEQARAGIAALVAPLAGWGVEAGPPDPNTW